MLGFFNLPGGWEWIAILVALLLLFGSRLPKVMRSMGKSVTEFKKGMQEGDTETPDDGAAAPPPNNEAPESGTEESKEQA